MVISDLRSYPLLIKNSGVIGQVHPPRKPRGQAHMYYITLGCSYSEEWNLDAEYYMIVTMFVIVTIGVCMQHACKICQKIIEKGVIISAGRSGVWTPL
jgi:hypothetical protein